MGDSRQPAGKKRRRARIVPAAPRIVNGKVVTKKVAK